MSGRLSLREEGSGDDWNVSDRLLPCLRLIFLALVLAIATYVRIRLLDIPLERDEGEYAYMGRLMLKGLPPYLHLYTMKLPGVGIAYAFIMSLFGETARGIHLGLLIINAANALLVYLLAQRLLDRNAAAVSCATYALLSLGRPVDGIYAHATHFVVLFFLASFLLLLRWQGKRKPLLLGASGLLLGVAVLMKQHTAMLAVFACLILARDAWKHGVRGFSAYLLFLLGLCIPYALTALWLAGLGLFGTFWFWTVTYAGKYASAVPLLGGLLNLKDAVILNIREAQWPLWLIGGLGGVFLGTSHGRRTDRVFLAGLTIFSFLAVCPGLYFREHYFIVLLPAVSLLAGFAVSASERAISTTRPGSAFRFIPLCLVITAVGYGVCQEREYLLTASPFEVSRSIYGVNPFPESLQIASYLQQHTAVDDKIAVIGSEPQIYFYADRPAATSYIYMYGLMEDQPFAATMQKEMITQLEENRPKYIVMVNTPASWLRKETSADLIFRWLDGYMPANYQPVGIIDIISLTDTVCKWDSQVKGYSPESVSSVVVYKRKN